MGVLTEQVVLELRPSDPRWLFEHPDAVGTAEARTITLPVGSAVSRELRWLITDPDLWSDGVVPQAVPAGLTAPARMLSGEYRRWWTSGRLRACRVSGTCRGRVVACRTRRTWC